MKILHKLKYELLIALFFVLIRLPHLGHDTFNTDVWKWKARSFDFSTGIFTMDFAKTLQKYHPGVTLMWVGTIAIKIANVYLDFAKIKSPLEQLFILHSMQKFFVVLISATTVAFIFFALRKLFDLPFAIFSILFLTLEPFYMALTREFHLEGLLTNFMLASVVWLFYYFEKKQNISLIIASFFCALALLTKSSAVYLLLFAGLFFLIKSYRTHKFKFELNWFLKYLLFSSVVVIFLWPALWVNPVHTLTEIIRGVREVGVDTEHIQYYFGKLVGDPGFTYYFVVFALRSSIFLFLGVFGLSFIIKSLSPSQRRFIMYLGLYSLFYLIQITLPTKKLDRYILPAFSAISLMASFFWLNITEKFRISRLWLFTIFIGVMLLINIAILPDFLSYYNPLFGGLRTGVRVLEPKWLIGEPQIISYFKQKQALTGFEYSGNTDSFEEIIYRQPPRNVLSVGFQEKYYTQIWPFFREIGAWAVIQDLTPFAQKTKYFVYPIWDDRAYQENRFTLKYLDDIKVRGITLYKVYERIE